MKNHHHPRPEVNVADVLAFALGRIADLKAELSDRPTYPPPPSPAKLEARRELLRRQLRELQAESVEGEAA